MTTDAPSVVPGPDHSIRGSELTTRVAFFTDAHRIIADVDTGPRRAEIGANCLGLCDIVAPGVDPHTDAQIKSW